DVVPREHRCQHQDQHDDLHQRAGAGDQAQDRRVVGDGRVHAVLPILAATGGGILTGRNVVVWTQASLTIAVASSSVPRRTCCLRNICPPPTSPSSTVAAISSLNAAGLRYSIESERTMNIAPCSRASASSSKPRERSHSVRARSRNLR